MDHSEHSIHHTSAPISMNLDHSHHDHTIMSSTPSPVETMMQMNHDEHQMHNMGHGGMRADDGSTPLHHMMSMSFHFGCNETILFSWWKIETYWGLIGSVVAIFVLALLYEGLKYYREYLFWKTYNLLEYRPVTGPSRQNSTTPAETPTTSAPTPVQYVGEVIHKQPPTMLSLNHFYQTLLHIVQVTLSFLLMLIFMTYNVWLCMAVVLGAAVGYFLFCWKKSVIVDVTEHCH